MKNLGLFSVCGEGGGVIVSSTYETHRLNLNVTLSWLGFCISFYLSNNVNPVAYHIATALRVNSVNE